MKLKFLEKKLIILIIAMDKNWKFLRQESIKNHKKEYNKNVLESWEVQDDDRVFCRANPIYNEIYKKTLKKYSKKLLINKKIKNNDKIKNKTY